MANSPQRPLLERFGKWRRTSMWSDSKLDVRNVSFIWKIDNFSLRPEKTGESLKSIVFSESKDSIIKWSLRVYPNGLKDNEFVSLFLYLEASDRKEICAKYKLALLNNREEPGHKFCEYSQTYLIECDPPIMLLQTSLEYSICDQIYLICSFEGSSAYFQIGKSWTDPKQHKFIGRVALNEELLPNDTFTLLCHISYSLDEKTISGRNSLSSLFSIPRCWSLIPSLFGKRTTVSSKLAKISISHQIANLYCDDRYSDVTFMVDGQQIKAHKLILSVRSPVFAAMFAHPFQESQSNRVEISDITEQVFKEMLRFIYSGEVMINPLSWQMFGQLLAVGDKYDLSDLKAFCEEGLVSNIKLETVCHLLFVADLHSAKQLKAKAIQYIKSNSNKVVKSDGWKIMVENPYILNQCFEAVVL